MKGKFAGMAVGLLCVALLFYTVKRSLYDGTLVFLDTGAGAAEENTLTVYADYSSWGETYEIAKDVIAATDPYFINVLRGSSGPEDGSYVYRYTLTEPVKKIYLSPPTLCIPETIEPVSAFLRVGETVSLNGEDWFSISSVDIRQPQGGVCEVVVTILPKNDILPRAPVVVIDGERHGGSSSLNFNEESIFDFGEFVFKLPAASAGELSERIENAEPAVGDILRQVYAGDAVFSSNDAEIEVIAQS